MPVRLCTYELSNIMFEQILHIFESHSRGRKMLIDGHFPQRVCYLSEGRDLHTRNRHRMINQIKYNNIFN